MDKSTLTTRQAAQVIGVKPQTLAVWRSTGRVKVPYHKVGRSVVYLYEDLVAFLDQAQREEV